MDQTRTPTVAILKATAAAPIEGLVVSMVALAAATAKVAPCCTLTAYIIIMYVYIIVRRLCRVLICLMLDRQLIARTKFSRF